MGLLGINCVNALGLSQEVTLRRVVLGCTNDMLLMAGVLDQNTLFEKNIIKLVLNPN